jgi:hypothetical protein
MANKEKKKNMWCVGSFYEVRFAAVIKDTRGLFSIFRDITKKRITKSRNQVSRECLIVDFVASPARAFYL